MPGLWGQGEGGGAAVPEATGEQRRAGMKEFLGKTPVSRCWQCPGEWRGVYFSAKDTLGRPSFRLIKDGLSAGPGAAEHRWCGNASLLCGQDGEVQRLSSGSW